MVAVVLFITQKDCSILFFFISRVSFWPIRRSGVSYTGAREREIWNSWLCWQFIYRFIRIPWPCRNSKHIYVLSCREWTAEPVIPSNSSEFCCTLRTKCDDFLCTPNHKLFDHLQWVKHRHLSLNKSVQFFFGSGSRGVWLQIILCALEKRGRKRKKEKSAIEINYATNSMFACSRATKCDESISALSRAWTCGRVCVYLFQSQSQHNHNHHQLADVRNTAQAMRHTHTHMGSQPDKRMRSWIEYALADRPAVLQLALDGFADEIVRWRCIRRRECVCVLSGWNGFHSPLLSERRFGFTFQVHTGAHCTRWKYVLWQ